MFQVRIRANEIPYFMRSFAFLLVARAEDPNGIPFTKAEVLHYLDGGSVQAIRKRFLINC